MLWPLIEADPIGTKPLHDFIVRKAPAVAQQEVSFPTRKRLKVTDAKGGHFSALDREVPDNLLVHVVPLTARSNEVENLEHVAQHDLAPVLMSHFIALIRFGFLLIGFGIQSLPSRLPPWRC